MLFSESLPIDESPFINSSEKLHFEEAYKGLLATNPQHQEDRIL